ncbi:S41 family peptidase [soil metagenome]
MKKLLGFGMLLVFCSAAFAQSNALWLRYPSISPDGKTIAFGYKGDIYRVDVNGGTAVPITIHESHDMMPIWSHDGKWIAFASDRYGNFDVFVMPATGGIPVRLTTNSAADYPYDFSPDDKKVIFGSGRNVQPSNVRFYSPGVFKNLYSVNVTGGKPILISGAGMDNAHYNSTGTQIVFQDRKGYENEWRKHHTSSVTRDIWIMDVKGNSYNKISTFEGEDREPVWGNDHTVFYLSEKSGTLNIHELDVTNKQDKQLTKFKNNPVRFLSRSNDATLCFANDGEIYIYKNGQEKSVHVQVFNDGRLGIERNVSVNGNVSEFALAPNGKEIAFVTRGEIFVTSVEGGLTKRITNTPQQERMIQWSPDSKTLLYAAERNDSWDIYKTTIARSEEPYFYASTVLKEEPVIATEDEEYQPKFSPDGKEIAYIENRNILKVYNIASKKSRTLLPEGHNYSYADGDWDYSWSPDSKWIIVDDSRGYAFQTNTGMIKADGTGQILYPVNSGFGEGNPKWALGGKMFTWTNERSGRKSLANQGSREVDVYGVFFDRDAYDRFKMSKEEFALWKEKDDNDKKNPAKPASADTAKSLGKTDSTKPAKKVFNPDLADLDARRVRLTINSASISDYIVNDDGSKLFYLASFEKGFDLWVTEPRTRDTKILAKLGGSPSGIEISKDGKSLFVTNNGSLVKIDAESGKITPIGINSEMTLNTAAERQYMFNHSWRQMKEKFYDPKLHGVDWAMYKKSYAKFLPHISNNYDFADLLSEMLGEINASHTGSGYRAQTTNPDATASLGLLYDETFAGEGLKIGEVLISGPVNKFNSKIKAGQIIRKIDGEEIPMNADWARLLNRKTNKNVLLTVFDPATNTTFDESVKPISSGEEGNLMYKRFVRRMQEMTDRLSGGKVGYVHVQGMNDESFRTTFEEVLGKNQDKDALIVDTRFNGGGWLHDDLSTFLSGKNYMKFAPQGHLLKGGEPMGRWQKPSCVLMSESNYSDAFMFPYVYKQNGIGKLIGMPVPGTGTAVWWETQIDPTIYFGIPMIASIGREGRPTENMQLEPDIKVPLKYEDLLNGKDTQLEAAVREMLRQIGAGGASGATGAVN